jgi:hypothetical protein
LNRHGPDIPTLLAYFTGGTRQTPVAWASGKEFEVIFDFRSANVTDKVGIITLM